MFVSLQAQRRNDHPGEVLHVRQNSGEQVGSLPWPSAGGVHGRVGFISVFFDSRRR